MFYERDTIGGPHVGGFYASHKPVHLHRANMRVCNRFNLAGRQTELPSIKKFKHFRSIRIMRLINKADITDITNQIVNWEDHSDLLKITQNCGLKRFIVFYMYLIYI